MREQELVYLSYHLRPSLRLPDADIENVEAELREEGIDPDELADSVQIMVDSKLEAYRAQWQAEVNAQHTAASQHLEEIADDASNLPTGIKGLKEPIHEILASPWGQQQQLAHAYRSWDNPTREDLRTLLIDLRTLQSRTQDDGDEQN